MTVRKKSKRDREEGRKGRNEASKERRGRERSGHKQDRHYIHNTTYIMLYLTEIRI